MSWTAPRTFVAGEVETAAIFNAHLRDNLLFLKSGVGLVTSVTAAVGPTVGATELVVATAPAFTADGSTLVEVMFSWYSTTLTVATDTFLMRLYDGPTAGSGTQIGEAFIPQLALGPGGIVRAILTPSAGSHTYTARLFRNAGTGTATANASATAKTNITVAQAN